MEDHHRQSRSDTKMHCVKLLGQRLTAAGFDRQTAELKVRIAVLSGYTTLDILITESLDQVLTRKGKFGLPLLCVADPEESRISGQIECEHCKCFGDPSDIDGLISTIFQISVQEGFRLLPVGCPPLKPRDQCINRSRDIAKM